MTIRFLADYGPYPARAIVTLSGPEETQLVAGNFATTNLAGGVPYVQPGVQTPARAPVQQDSPQDFASAKLRGMGSGPVTEGAYVDQTDYWPVFLKFRANVTRRFLTPTAAAYGQPYTTSALTITQLKRDTAFLWAKGVRTVLVIEPLTAGQSVKDAASPAWWLDPGALSQLVEYWRWLAGQLLNTPGLIFDILNEPIVLPVRSTASTEVLLALQERCITAIRSVDQARTCMVECNDYGASYEYSYMRPVADQNTVYSLHLYPPLSVTHAFQLPGVGAYPDTWPSQNPVSGGLPYLDATNGNRNRLRLELAPAINFRQRNAGVQLFCGEYSCARTTPGDTATNWVEDAVVVLAEAGISSSYHKFGFLPEPWAPLHLPHDGSLVDSTSGTGASGVPLSTFTNVFSPAGRAPIAPLAQSFVANALAGVPAAAVPVFVAACSFDGSGANPWKTNAGTSGTGSVDFASTANALSLGAKHARFSVGATASSTAFSDFPSTIDTPSSILSAAHFLRFKLCVNQAVGTSAWELCVVSNNDYGGTLRYWSLQQVAGASVWRVVLAASTVSAVNPTFAGFDLTPGVIHTVEIEWVNATATYYGRWRLVLNGRAIADINTVPTADSATISTTSVCWKPAIGVVSGNQTGRIVDIFEGIYSRGARAY